MKKLGIILDSSCGLSKKEAEEKGFMFLPIVIDFEGKEYFSGIDIDNDFLIKNMQPETKVKTASVKLGEMEKVFKEAIQKYEKVIFITLSKHISSLNQMAKNLAKEISDNILVYDSEHITPWIIDLIPEIEKEMENGDMDKIIEILESSKNKMFAYIILKNLDYLYRGGRISKTQYFAGNLLKIFPIIKVDNGKLDQHDVIKGRTKVKAIGKVVDAIEKDFKFLKSNYNDYTFKVKVLNLNSEDDYNLTLEKIKESTFGDKFDGEAHLAPEIVTHIGPGAVLVTLIPIKKEVK